MRLIVAAALAIFAASCGDERARGNGSPGDMSRFYAGSDTGLILSVFAPRDTVPLGDSVLIGAIVHNNGDPRRFWNSPDFFQFTVVGPHGDTLAPVEVWSDLWAPVPAEEMLLPQNAALEQLTNLSCARWPFAPAKIQTHCLWQFRMETPGEYKIVVRYTTVTISVAGAPAPRGISLISDTVRILRR